MYENEITGNWSNWGGCISTKFCDACQIQYYNTLCVCAKWLCNECNGLLSIIKGKEGKYRFFKNGVEQDVYSG